MESWSRKGSGARSACSNPIKPLLFLSDSEAIRVSMDRNSSWIF